MPAIALRVGRFGMAGAMLLALVMITAAHQFPWSASWTHPQAVLTGFYDLEGERSGHPYRWTDREAVAWFSGVGIQPRRLRLTWNSPRPAGVPPPSVLVTANGHPLQSFTVGGGVQTVEMDVPAQVLLPAGDLAMRIISDTFNPPSDPRALGVIVYDLRLEPPAGPAPVLPAPLPLAWGLVVTALLYASVRARRSPRAAWLGASGGALLLAGLVALDRLAAAAILPWAVLAASLAFAITRRE